MAGTKSDYWADAVLYYTLRGTAIPVLPGSLYLALFTAGPNSAGVGTEVSGGSYARVALTRAGGTFDAPSPVGVTANTAVISFPTPTVDWGTVVGWALYDASTGGNMIYFGDLSAGGSCPVGIAVTVPIGDLDITER